MFLRLFKPLGSFDSKIYRIKCNYRPMVFCREYKYFFIARIIGKTNFMGANYIIPRPAKIFSNFGSDHCIQKQPWCIGCTLSHLPVIRL